MTTADKNQRVAIVTGGADSLRHVAAYMPANYQVAEVELGPSYKSVFSVGVPTVYIIAGTDNAGWTLDGYVIPRLASGLIFAQEVSFE